MSVNNNPTMPLAQEVPKVPSNQQNKNNNQNNQNQQGQSNAPIVPNIYSSNNNQPNNFDQQLSGAPQTMTQNQPSTFSPNEKPKQKRLFRKRTCFGCCCSMFLLLVLVLVGLGAYSFFSETDIPVVTDVVEMIQEKFFPDPVKEAKAANKQVAASLMGMLAPMMSDSKTLFEDGIDEQYLENIFGEYSEIKSYRYDIYTKGTDKDGSEMEMIYKGAVDIRDVYNPKGEVELNFDIPFEGINFKLGAFVKVMDGTGYIKLDSYPKMADEYVSLSEIEDQWIDLSDAVEFSERYNKLFQGKLLSSTTDQIQNEPIKKEDLEKFVEFLNDDAVVGNAEFIEDENIKGNDCRCVQTQWNGEEFEEAVNRYYEIFEEEKNVESIDEISEKLEQVGLITCSSKQTDMVHKVKFYAQMKDRNNPDDVVAVTSVDKLEVEAKMWDFNSDVRFETPSETISAEEALDRLLTLEYKDKLVTVQLKAIDLAVAEYTMENGKFPDSLDQTELGADLFFVEDAEYKLRENGESYVITAKLPSGKEVKLGNVSKNVDLP